MSGPFTQTALANHLGVTQPAVAKAIKSGRLRESLVIVDGKTMIEDLELASLEWAENTDHSRLPDSTIGEAENAGGKVPALAESRARKEAAAAVSAELDVEKKRAELIYRRDMVSEVGAMIVAARTKLLGVPARAKEAMPHLAIDDIEKFDSLLREALEDVSAYEASIGDSP